mgnify:CR=1 FL=1
MATVLEQLRGILSNLERRTGITATAVVRRDGLLIAHDFTTAEDPRLVAALAASLVGSAERAVSELKKGKISYIATMAEEGLMLTVRSGDVILVALAPKDANLGLILLEVERASKQIEQVLGM